MKEARGTILSQHLGCAYSSEKKFPILRSLSTEPLLTPLYTEGRILTSTHTWQARVGHFPGNDKGTLPHALKSLAKVESFILLGAGRKGN